MPFRIRWKNFRGFRDTGDIEFKPLTILIGPNNSGKSSLIQPLLLMRQTLLSPPSSQPLVLRGDLVRAGDFKDLVTCGNTNLDISFSVDFHFHGQPQSKRGPVGSIPPGGVTCIFSWDSRQMEMVLSKYVVVDTYNRILYQRNRTQDGSYDLSSVRGFFKQEDLSGRNSTDLKMRRKIRAAAPEHFLFLGEQLFTDILTETIEDDSYPPPPMTVAKVRNYVAISEFAVSGLRDLLCLNISYLGPLRESPRRVYETSGQPPNDVGINGNRTPELILNQFNRPISGSSTLTKWLKHFDLPPVIKAQRLNDLTSAFSLIATTDDHGTEVNFADLGFGVSQLLPLIVQCLITSEGHSLITEQPEIHLNPKLQAGLADLFVDVVQRKGSVIVETHSEHLLTRIRRLVAEGKISSGEVAIYYIEHDSDGSRVREVPMTKIGHVDANDWPEGFFDQGYREASGLAKAQRALKSNES